MRMNHAATSTMTQIASIKRAPSSIIPAFPVGAITDNLWMAPDAFIHAGFNAMKTLWRPTPNG
jgi:hypothetical protein